MYASKAKKPPPGGHDSTGAAQRVRFCRPVFSTSIIGDRDRAVNPQTPPSAAYHETRYLALEWQRQVAEWRARR